MKRMHVVSLNNTPRFIIDCDEKNIWEYINKAKEKHFNETDKSLRRDYDFIFIWSFKSNLPVMIPKKEKSDGQK